MNGILPSLPPLSEGPLVASQVAQVILAQAPPPEHPMMRGFQQYVLSFAPSVAKLLGAIVILIIGWIVAAIAASVTRNLLKRTDVDNRVVGWVRGTQQGPQPNVEKWAALVVFWVILIIAIVAFLNALQLTAVAEPLKNFLNQIFIFLPKLGAAAILLGIAWILATLAKNVVIRSSQSFGLDERLEQAEEGVPENQFLLSETLGNALYWFIFLFFLPLILGVLDLQGPLQPVQNLLNELLAALPKILKALLIGALGWFIARIVRTIVSNLLSAAGTDRLGTKLGLSRTTAGQSLSGLIGTVVYVLILIPTAIAALDALEIQAISAPAVSMLNQMLNAIPQIFTAALILVIAYVISQFVAELVKNLLTGIGFNNLFAWLGLAATPEEPTATETAEPTPTQPTWTPSEVLALATQVGIMLFATVAATNILNIPALTLIMAGLLVIFGQILVGLLIFAVGLYLANLAFSLIIRSGSKESQFLGQAARIAIIALVSAMALQQMGIASNIINLAFGLLLGAIAVAIALAFGLGGREIAAEKIREWLSSFRQD